MKNILGLIFNKLIWIEDRLHFKLVCKLWWESTQILISRPPILFKKPNQWKMSYCRGWITEYDSYMIEFNGFAQEQELYIQDTPSDQIIAYYGIRNVKVRRMLDHHIGFFNDGNLIRQVDESILVWIGNTYTETFTLGGVNSLFMRIEQLYEFNENCLRSFYEILKNKYE